MNRPLMAVTLLTALVHCSAWVAAEDWTRFRGPGGSGISSETVLPVEFSDTKHLKWKTSLPGAGSSSPVVSGNHIFLTCYKGTGNDVVRYLVCVLRDTGKIAWQKTIETVTPEDAYRGFINEHGYASNTPVTDGKHVFAFFGKSGVFAFDFEGKQLWQTGVGTSSSNRRWGSAASLTLYKNTVIVNAAEESRTIYALNKADGKEVWKAKANSLELAYGTPTLVKTTGGKEELVIGVPGEVWALNPDNGKLNWYAETRLTGNLSPSVVAGDGVVYAFGGFQSSGSVAIRTGGSKDVTKDNTVWSTRNSSYVATPLLYQGHLYWVDDRGYANCTSAKTGESVYRERLRGVSGGGRPFYASPVLAGGKLYVPSRRSGVFVFAAKPEFEQLAQNKFAGDNTDFNATPAISNGQMLIRSDSHLYCIAK